jgi:hypothetical protein
MRVPTRLAARVGAVVAIAAIALAAVTSVADAKTAPPPKKIATTLTISVRSVVNKHGRVIEEKITGHLTAGGKAAPGQLIWLQRSVVNPKTKKSEWVSLRSQRTNANGNVVFISHFPATTTVRLIFKGSGKLSPATSPPVTIRIP